ncbi:hypothetical protein BU26DRAFT_508284 [Trematosphaeria pertusa]|uniref:Zn(2)-C6 fungal-type domain-containing protein n=1 Tax=Trematosphaeria pertusa TaxID=390896 RepID=A0A6A6I5N5_9PLEO|nr:uncharacterized protein BU26DRAFT_508284 [Trematosphaeria pertusa]KAF2245661.1 hypothetical protein BU26DRAFT_508284 [Trematosphaeria pertusa]
MLPESQRRGSCKPCRESQAQCDKKKPRCSECVTNNKPCGGYDMGHIFINVNSTGPPPVWNRSQNAQKYLVLDMASQPTPTQEQVPVIPATSLPPTSLAFCSMGGSSSMTALAPPALPTYPVPDSDPNNIPGIVELFLDLYYRRNGLEKTSTDLLSIGNECGGWRSLLPYWLGQSPILDTAIGALAASFVGTQYEDESLIDQGRNMYLNALQMVQHALPEPDSSDRKDLLATTLVMSSTELFLSNGGGPSQLTHIEGATRLLHGAFKSMDFEEIHVYILNQGLFESISTRRRYAFSSPSWRPLIRQLYSVPRTSRNDLYFQWCETILPLPNILSAADSVTTSAASSRTSTPTPASAVLGILDDLTTLEQSLAPWSELLKANTPGPWTFPAAQISADSVPFPLQFVSIEVCTLFCLHWASQLLILDARHALHAHLPLSEIPEHPSPATLLPQMTEYASLICRSIQFCTQNTSFASTENMFLPLFVVASYYMRNGDEDRMKWCVGAFSRIASEQKIGYAIEKLDLTERRVNVGVYNFGGVWDEA